MPARADHEQRRRHVARIAADLVADGGLGAATHRRIAEAGGCSTTLVSHYFADKRDLVTATYAEVGDRVTSRLDAVAGSAEPLLGVLEALLPLDADRIRDWRLLFTFLGVAATDAELAEEQRARAATARARIERAVLTEQSAGRLRADLDPDATARQLLSVALGAGLQALFDPHDWSADQMRAVLDGVLAPLRPGAADRPS